MLTGHYAQLSMARQEFERKDRVGGVASPVFQDVIDGLPQMLKDMAEYENVLDELGARPVGIGGGRRSWKDNTTKDLVIERDRKSPYPASKPSLQNERSGNYVGEGTKP